MGAWFQTLDDGHKHTFKPDAKDKDLSRCECGFTVIAKARLGESSIDCPHIWNVSKKGVATCSRCGYRARGSSYIRWWKLYAKVDWRQRPYCLNSREPTLKFGSVCDRCLKVAKPVIV